MATLTGDPPYPAFWPGLPFPVQQAPVLNWPAPKQYVPVMVPKPEMSFNVTVVAVDHEGLSCMIEVPAEEWAKFFQQWKPSV